MYEKSNLLLPFETWEIWMSKGPLLLKIFPPELYTDAAVGFIHPSQQIKILRMYFQFFIRDGGRGEGEGGYFNSLKLPRNPILETHFFPFLFC